MNTAGAHAASDRLALLAVCGDLVVAFDATTIVQVRTADDTPSRVVDGMTVLTVGDEDIPAWDLGVLLGWPQSSASWVIVDLPSVSLRIGLGLDRCLAVHELPICRAIPPGLFAQRRGGIGAGFSTAGFPEVAGYPSGVVVDPSTLLADAELRAGRKLTRGTREPTRQR